MKSNTNIVLGIGVVVMTIFPILPSFLKPICVFVFVPSFFFLLRNGINLKPFLGPLLMFVFAAISLFQTTDLAMGIQRMEILLPLFAFPMIFGVFTVSFFKKVEIEFWRTKFLIGFLLSSAVLTLIMYLYVGSLGYFSNTVTYDYCMSYIEAYMWGANDHPIYLSLILGVGIFLGIEYMFKNTTMVVSLKLIMVLGMVFCFSGIMFLERKGIIISLFIALIIYLWRELKLSNQWKQFLLIGVVIMGVVIVSSYSNRFNELIQKESYTVEINEKNSTSIRLGIYICSLDLAKRAGFWGVGIGDQQQKLNECYESKSEFLLKGNYNTHNQYLSYLLGSGWLGLVIFIICVVLMVANGIRFESNLLLGLTIFFFLEMLTENILERQTGVILFSFIVCFFTYTDQQKRGLQ